MSMTGSLPDGWSVFGPYIEGATAPLQRARGPEGQTGIVVQVRRDMRNHPLLTDDLDLRRGFLDDPGVPRVLPLLHRDPSGTSFLYEIGDGRLLAEIMQGCRARDQVPGARAALELVSQVARILHAASVAGAAYGLPSHSNLTPWRVVVDPGGQVSLLGYGLPPVEAIEWLDGQVDAPPGPDFRYSPPERIEDTEKDEDIRSDLYSLGVMAVELALGAPLLEGDADSLAEQIHSQAFWSELSDLSGMMQDTVRPLLTVAGKRSTDAGEVARNAKQLVWAQQGGASLAQLVNPTEAPEALDLEDEIPVPPLAEPDPDEEITDPTLKTEAGPVQSENVVPWTGEADSFGEESELVAFEEMMASSRLSANPPPRVMELLPKNPTPVPSAPTSPERTSPRSPRRVWSDEQPLVMLTGVNVDLASQRVIARDGTETKLNEQQAAVLRYLLKQEPGHDVTVEDLWQGALGGRHFSPESMRGFVDRLREYIERDNLQPDHLVDGNRSGYRFQGWEAAVSSPVPEGELVPRGRKDETERLLEFLKSHVLATVVGPPGSGAFRVARAVARCLQAGEYDVHWAATTGKTAFATTLARSMAIRSVGRPSHAVLTDIGEKLGSDPHIVALLEMPRPSARVASTVEGWLAQQPSGIVIVAARSPLGIEGETVFRMPVLGAEEAMALLRALVEEHRPGTELSDETALAIVDHVDRMPVAIESAAAHTAFLTPEALLDRLRANLELDFGQGSLEAMDANLVEIVHELDDVERTVLEQLSMFQGSFDLEAAETSSLVRVPEGQRRSMLSILDGLVAKSLLRPIDVPESTPRRWALFAPIQQHLARILDDSTQEQNRQRHLKYYGPLGLRLGSGPWMETGPRNRLLLERQNLEGALEAGAHQAYEAAGAAIGLTAIMGRLDAESIAASVDELARNLTKPRNPTNELLWAAARLASARAAVYLGHSEKAREAIFGIEAPSLDARLRTDLAWLHAEVGSKPTDIGKALFKLSTADPWVLALKSLLEGRQLHLESKGTSDGKASAAHGLMQIALHGFQSLGASVGVAVTQRHMAEASVRMASPDAALAELAQALHTFETLSDATSALECRIRMAELLLGLDDLPRAADHLHKAIDEATALSAFGQLAFARGLLAVLYALDPQPEHPPERYFHLALAAPFPKQKRIRALFALHLLRQGRAPLALAEAKNALPAPEAKALVAILERGSPPTDEGAFLVYDALETWRARAPLGRIQHRLGKGSSVAVQLVLTAPPPQGEEP